VPLPTGTAGFRTAQHPFGSVVGMSTPSDATAVPEDALATEQRTAAVIYNPVKVHLPTLKRTVNRYQREAGWAETKWYATSEEDPGGGVAREALDAGADVIAAAGGDGTVRAVAEVVHGSDAALALLPSGTGNLLARNIPAPIDDLGASAHTIFHGEDRAIDIGTVRVERPDGSREQFGFLVMAGLGLDARMLVNTNDDLKKKVGWLAYVDSLVRSLRDADAFEFRYRLDGEANRSVRAHSLIVGNCGMLQAGATLLPDAEIDDGYFDVVVMRPHGFFGWVRIGARVFWENAILRRFRRSALGKTEIGKSIVTKTRDERPLRYLRGEEFTARLERPEEFEIDGDPVGEVRAFRAKIDAGGLTVRVAGPEDQTRATRRR
jgi:diacylglycerol kinase (ATP)